MEGGWRSDGAIWTLRVTLKVQNGWREGLRDGGREDERKSGEQLILIFAKSVRFTPPDASIWLPPIFAAHCMMQITWH